MTTAQKKRIGRLESVTTPDDETFDLGEFHEDMRGQTMTMGEFKEMLREIDGKPNGPPFPQTGAGG